MELDTSILPLMEVPESKKWRVIVLSTVLSEYRTNGKTGVAGVLAGFPEHHQHYGTASRCGAGHVGKQWWKVKWNGRE